MFVGGTADVVGSADIDLEVIFLLVVFVCMMGLGCVEIVVFVVLDVGGSDVVVCVIVGKDEGGNIVVNGCTVLFETVGVVAIVNAGDVGCVFFLRAITKDGYQYCLAITSGPLRKILISVRLAAGHNCTALLFT